MASLKDLVRNIIPNCSTTVKVESVEQAESKSSGQDKLTFQGTITAGENRGKTIYWSRSLQPQALWRLAGDLINAGFDAEVGDDPTKWAAALAEIAEGMEKQVYNVNISVTEGRNGKFNDVEVVSPFDRVASVPVVPSRQPVKVTASDL